MAEYPPHTTAHLLHKEYRLHWPPKPLFTALLVAKLRRDT